MPGVYVNLHFNTDFVGSLYPPKSHFGFRIGFELMIRWDKHLNAWKRCVAKYIDYGIYFFVTLFVVFRNLDLIGNILETHFLAPLIILGIGFTLLLDSLILWRFQSTLGKWLLGIRLHHPTGKITFIKALKRTFKLFALGGGCGLPILFHLAQLLQYYLFCKNGINSWDCPEKNTMTFKKIGVLRGILGLILGALGFCFVNLILSMLIDMPTFILLL